MYKVMLVDDEQSGLELMETLLTPYREEFKVCAKCNSVAEAKMALLCCVPDLIFLDIQMPEENGFDLVKDFKNLGKEIPFVFITAYSKYMPQAFKVQPLDYLLKPVDKIDLAEMLLRFKRQVGKKEEGCSLPQGILTDKGVEFIRPEDIVYIQMKNRKSCIYMFDGSLTYTTKTLKELLSMLSESTFCKIHKSTLVNLKHVAKLSSQHLYVNTEKHCIQLVVGRSFAENLKAKLHI